MGLFCGLTPFIGIVKFFLGEVLRGMDGAARALAARDGNLDGGLREIRDS